MYNTDMPTRAELPTTRQLLRSTAIAAVSAVVILVTVVLPSEYAIDPTGVGRALGLTEMGEIKTQLADEAEQDRLNAQPMTSPKPQSSIIDRVFRELVIGSAVAQTAQRSDEMTIVLKPGQGAEVKLAMVKGAKATFSWTVTGGTVNFDLHGDGGGQETSYEKGRSVPGDEGTLEAAFDGNHGWFWRNRGKTDVTVTLKTNGVYSSIERKV